MSRVQFTVQAGRDLEEIEEFISVDNPDAAARLLRPGGRLVYAVCSLQPEEAAPRIARAVAGGGLRADPFTGDELAFLPEARTADGFLRTHPGLWPTLGGMDGFFAARLVRA